jgi:hypothetical protein
MNEEYGNISDGFFLSQEEVNNLRNAKKKLTDYGREQLKKLKEKQDKKDTDK